MGSLFSGYGGLEMGVISAIGGEVAWHCETASAAAAVLRHRFPGIPNLGDITSVDFGAVRRVDVLIGGFPCQDISQAGKGAGIQEGTRSGLWSEMCRAICEIRPRLVVVENVGALLRRGMGRVLGDLAKSGYDAQWCCVRASDAGAPHRRERVFIVASDMFGIRWSQSKIATTQVGPVAWRNGANSSIGDATEPGTSAGWAEYSPAIRRWERIIGRQHPTPTELVRGVKQMSPEFSEWMMGLDAGWVTGVPGLSRAQMFTCLGNGVVPQQAALAVHILMSSLIDGSNELLETAR